MCVGACVWVCVGACVWVWVHACGCGCMFVCNLCNCCHVILDRASLHRRTGSFTAAVEDCQQAMDKCGYQQDTQVYCNASRQLILTYNDFALDCFKKRQFDYAIVLLNKAIKEEKEETGLYLNRGGKYILLYPLVYSALVLHLGTALLLMLVS